MLHEVGAIVSFKDYASDNARRLKRNHRDLRDEMDGVVLAADRLEKSLARMAFGAAVAGAGALIAGSMLSARMEVARLEGNIRSLGVSAADVKLIGQSTDQLASKLGIAKERILTGIYDIKSAASDLDNQSLANFTESVALAAIATKGNFEDLAKTFGMVYNQFKPMYKGMSDAEFGRNIANDIAWAANKFRADGATIDQAFTSLGSSAATARISLEEQTAVIGRLLNTMIPMTAGTSFRTFVDKIPEAARKLGLSAFDASGKMRAIPDILDQINKKFPNLQMAGKQLNEAFTEEGVKMIKELSPYVGKLRAEITELKTASANKDFSFLDSASKANLETVPALIDRIREGTHALWTSMATGVTEALGIFLRPLASMIDTLNALPLSVKSTAGVIVALAAAAAMAGGSVIFFTSAWSAWKALGTITGLHGHVLALNSLNAAHLTGAVATLANTKAQIINNAAIRYGALSRTISVGVLGLERMAVSASTVLYGLLTGKVSLATAAQWAWNAAMMANPIGLVIAAVVALTAAVGGLLYFSGAFDEMMRKRIDLHAEDAIDQVRTLHKELFALGIKSDAVAAIADDIERGRKSLSSGTVFTMDNRELEASKQYLEDQRSKMQSLMDTLDPTSTRYRQLSTDVEELNRRMAVMKEMRGFAFENLNDLGKTDLIARLEAYRNMRISARMDTTDVDHWLKKLNEGQEVPIVGKITAWERITTPGKWIDGEALSADIDAALAAAGHRWNGIVVSTMEDGVAAGMNAVRTTISTTMDWIEEKWASATGSFAEAFDRGITAFSNLIDKLKARAYAAGRGFITAFVSGVQDFSSRPINAVLDILAGIGRYLPHSDADMGPLSRLTESGRALPETFAAGVSSQAPVAISHMEQFAASLLPSVPPGLAQQARGSEPVPVAPLLKIDIQSLIGQLNVEGRDLGGGSMNDMSVLIANLLRSLLEAHSTGAPA